MNEKLYKAINAKMHRDKDNVETYRDMLSLLDDAYLTDGRSLHERINLYREDLQKAMKRAIEREDYMVAEDIEGFFYEAYRIEAVDLFDSFCVFLEHKRKPSERFYEPRRKVLAPITKGLQELADDELDELCISQPPRTGKTTLVQFFTVWMMGRKPNETSLYASYSDRITKKFYEGALEIINDTETYAYKEVFNFNVRKSADEETVNLDRRTKYPTLTCRSVGSAMNGCCDASQILVGDDLIGTIEEALSPDRLEKAWMFVENDMIPRTKEKCKYLWMGTRWSINDPEGKRLQLLRDSPAFSNRRWRFLNLPALDDNDESNFDYDYEVGFSTQTYHQRRASFEAHDDMASWLAQYMGEPIEREGVLFSSSTMNYFSELPEDAPDRIFMAVDPAFGGGDYVAAPICYQYDNSVYVVDVVFDKHDKAISQPNVASKIRKWGVRVADFEATKATQSYAEGVRALLNGMNYHCTVRTHSAPANKSKEARIYDCAPDIRDSFYFLFEKDRSNEYQMFMSNVFQFTITGKNKHDDAPDSLAMASNMAFNDSGAIHVFRRRF